MMQTQGHKLLTLNTVSRLLSKELITSEALTRYCYNLAISGEKLWKLNAFYNLNNFESLLEYARAADERRQQKKELSILDGIPISIKANIAVSTQPLTAGSIILGHNQYNKNNDLCGYDSDVARILLKECGAILIGITNMDEFGMGSLGTNIPTNAGSDDHFNSQSKVGPTRNPQPYIQNLWKNKQWNNNDNKDFDRSLAEMILQSSEVLYAAHEEAISNCTMKINSSNKDEKIRNSDVDVNNYYSAGGSSCGSAVSVAHGSSLFSIGTDTGGSIRLPSSWCGIIGLKPSYGLISRHGIVSYASSFDTVGVIAPSVDCASIVLDKLAQRQEQHKYHAIMDSNSSFYSESESESLKQSTSSNYINGYNNKSEQQNKLLSLKGIKIGIPEAFVVSECPKSLKRTWSDAAKYLKSKGATIQIISNEVISHNILKKSLASYYVLVSAEASSNLSRYDGFRYGFSSYGKNTDEEELPNSNSENNKTLFTTPLQQQYATTRTYGFGKEVIRRILCGTSVLSSDRFHTYYESAAKLRAILVQQFDNALKKNSGVDFLLLPTTIFPLPQPIGVDVDADCGLQQQQTGIEQQEKVVDNTEMFANDIMTVPISLAGLPSISVSLPFNISNKAEKDELVLLSSSPSENKSTSNTSTINDKFYFPATAGFQLVGQRLEEGNLLKVAKILEQLK